MPKHNVAKSSDKSSTTARRPNDLGMFNASGEDKEKNYIEVDLADPATDQETPQGPHSEAPLLDR